MFHSRGRHARKRQRGAWAGWAGWAGWVGPLFALEALLVTFGAGLELRQASARQRAELAEYARGGTL